MIDDMRGECSTSSGHALQRDQKILAALELADRILDRDGLQELRGLAWHDGERWAIREAIESLKGKL